MEDQEPESEGEVKSDIKSTKAYNILTALQDDHIIDEDTFNKFLKKLVKIQDCIVNYMEFEKLLDKRLNALKEENTKTLNEYAFLSKQQNDLNDKISKKLEEREQAKSQLTEYETNRALKSNYDIERNLEEIAKLKQAIKENEDRQTAQLLKELSEIENENQQKKDEIQKLIDDIAKEEENFKNLTSLKEKMEFEKKKIEKEISDLNSNIDTKINQIENDNRTNKLNEDAKKRLEEEIKKKTINLDQISKDNKKLVNENNVYVEKIKQLEEQSKKLFETKNNLEKEFNLRESENKQLSDKIKSNFEKRSAYENEKKRKQKNLEVKRDNLKKEQLRASQNERNKTNLESKVGSESMNLLDEENKISKDNLMLKKLREDFTNIEEQIRQVLKSKKEKEEKVKKEEECKKVTEDTRAGLDKNYNDLKAIEKNIIKRTDQARERIEEIKAKKENIMRTKERLDEKTNLINEEIQIKELIFLDMTKKYEELRHMYQKYNVLYKTVLGERNKNVVKIQNSNQNRAELKEKMKILVTEMDILDSELSEIYNKIIDKDKDLNKMSTKFNSLKQEINQYGLKNLKYKEEITKLTNENEKLHSIINSIENEMVSFRVDYELACESRNYTGIQLIDRNDELCIFYEKIHHIETRINELYKKILEKEAVVKRSAVEVKEIERFIEVNRKKIPEIPELSNKIKELDTELKILNQTLEKLIKYVENPENNLKNELPGEDLDINYLRLKYDQLTEFLNEKKEKLLEKELINDEINEIAEKLRKKALEDRGKNLKISKEINEYEIKLNDITRKNIASTSELSMFQAILTKLESTKREKEETYELLEKRFKNGLPPPKEWLSIYQSQKTVQSNRRQYINNRMQEIRDKENIIIGQIPIRKGPEKRVEEYIDPKTGLPSCVYGKYAPFNPYAEPNNMRHLRKMQERLRKPEENQEKDRVVQI